MFKTPDFFASFLCSSELTLKPHPGRIYLPLPHIHTIRPARFLTYCPSKRILSDEGLKHEYFRETPLPIDPSMFPTWPAKSEQQRVKMGSSPRPPEGGLGYSQLVRTLGSTFSITYI